MGTKITIIGLNQVSASIGMALGKIKDQVTRTGNDREPSVARQAEKLGATDKTTYNIPSAVRDADVVILGVPVDEIRETLEIIAQDLKPGAVVIDTAPVKEKVMTWARELLSEKDRYFVTITLTQNPKYIRESSNRVDNAHADLFENSLMMISSLPGTDESALELTSNLAQILGAKPLFSDPVESDGLLASTCLMPRLVSVAMVNATTSQSGWIEARKVAGQIYAQLTEPALYPEEVEELGKAALINAENTVRVIDQLLLELSEMRDAIAAQNDQELKKRLERARQERENWWQVRQSGDWEQKTLKGVSLPTGGEVLGRLIGLRPKKNP